MTTPTLTDTQTAWLRSNGITLKAGFFSKGARFITPARGSARRSMMEIDTHEDSDGERCVGTFPTIKEALRALAA